MLVIFQTIKSSVIYLEIGQFSLKISSKDKF